MDLNGSENTEVQICVGSKKNTLRMEHDAEYCATSAPPVGTKGLLFYPLA